MEAILLNLDAIAILLAMLFVVFPLFYNAIKEIDKGD